MKKANLNTGNRQFYVYSFPDAVDDNGNFEITLLTDTDFYATSISSGPDESFFLYNLSTETQTMPTGLPLQTPLINGRGGTPYFFPVPWRLKAGTLLRLVTSSGSLIAQMSLAGYRA